MNNSQVNDFTKIAFMSCLQLEIYLFKRTLESVVEKHPFPVNIAISASMAATYLETVKHRLLSLNEVIKNGR